MLLWAAEHGNLYVLQDVYYCHGDYDNLHRAMIHAITRGHLDIVKFIFEQRGPDLLDYVDGDKTFPCPLVMAIKQGDTEVMEYLYAWFVENQHDAFSYGPALCAATSSEVAKRLCAEQAIETSDLETAFACAAGKSHIEIMKLLQCSDQFNISFIDRAFAIAAGCDQMDAVKYLSKIEGYHTSTSALQEAFIDAAGGGYLGHGQIYRRYGKYFSINGCKSLC
ncbi:unnamed protein product [Phytophthora lilii]|uniref:Unnamed protein product n=1 Tax=Phytophthora lilii TaxID=2077276 RepID=A0A9W6TXL8_9STRA|nr:unnamed protein product [Phytophthora lilii]